MLRQQHSPPMTNPSSRAVGKGSLQADSGLLERFSKHRQYNHQISSSLARDMSTVEVAKRIALCSHQLLVEVQEHSLGPTTAHLRGSRACNARLCPWCEWRRSKVWRARLFKGLARFEEHHLNYRAVFLTLTVKNCRLTDLKKTIKEMNTAWNRMRQLSFFPTAYWLKRTEVTVAQHLDGSGPLSEPWVHPHFHVLLLVRPSYFGKGYVKKTEWQKQWMMALRADYAPVVDVRCAYAKGKRERNGSASSFDAAIESSKYLLKAASVQKLGPWLTELHHQLRSLRLTSVSTKLSEYVPSKDPETPDLEVDDRAPSIDVTGRWLALAQWFEDRSEFQITEIREGAPVASD